MWHNSWLNILNVMECFMCLHTDIIMLMLTDFAASSILMINRDSNWPHPVDIKWQTREWCSSVMIDDIWCHRGRSAQDAACLLVEYFNHPRRCCYWFSFMTTMDSFSVDSWCWIVLHCHVHQNHIHDRSFHSTSVHQCVIHTCGHPTDWRVLYPDNYQSVILPQICPHDTIIP